MKNTIPKCTCPEKKCKFCKIVLNRPQKVSCFTAQELRSKVLMKSGRMIENVNYLYGTHTINFSICKIRNAIKCYSPDFVGLFENDEIITSITVSELIQNNFLRMQDFVY